MATVGMKQGERRNVRVTTTGIEVSRNYEAEWWVEATFSRRAGPVYDDLVLTRLSVESRTDPPVPVSANILRRIPIAEIQADAMRSIAEAKGMYADGAHAELTAELFAGLDLTGRADIRRAFVARAYVDASNAGSRSPRQDVAEALGWSSEQVRDELHAARRQGLLRGAGAGRSGGELTEKAVELLATVPTKTTRKGR